MPEWDFLDVWVVWIVRTYTGINALWSLRTYASGKINHLRCLTKWFATTPHELMVVRRGSLGLLTMACSKRRCFRPAFFGPLVARSLLRNLRFGASTVPSAQIFDGGRPPFNVLNRFVSPPGLLYNTNAIQQSGNHSPGPTMLLKAVSRVCTM